MKKIIFREVAPEAVETDILYDDDFIRGKGGDGYENGILYGGVKHGKQKNFIDF